MRPPFREEMKRWGWLILLLYLVLLVVSQFHLRAQDRVTRGEDPEKKVINVDGKKLAYLQWGDAGSGKPPLILLHGSPASGARDWEDLGPALASSGRRVIAIDRFGYGASEQIVHDYSFNADREAVLGLMDALGLAKAHVAGWSYGGGPAIMLGEMDGDRILSVTLVAALGVQKGEGSGNYSVEQCKYALLYVLTNWVAEAVPHFGLLGSRAGRRAFARDFTDMDQRNMEVHLRSMTTPMLIIHGKNDPLVAAWVAKEHHLLKPTSRLVLLDCSHFFPFQPDSAHFRIAAEEMTAFLAAADVRKASSLYGQRNETSRTNMKALWDDGGSLRGYKPWYFVLLGGMVLGFFIPRTGGVLAGLAGGLLLIDAATGIAAVALGALIKRGESRTRFHKAALVVVLGIMAVIPAMMLISRF